MSAPPFLQAEAISVALGGRRILDGASLAARPGELVALVGANGAGKTTLLRALAGLIPASGSIMIGGEPLAALSLRERARRIAYLPQGHVFSWPLDAAAIVALGRHPHADPFGRLGEGDQRAVAGALEAAGIAHLADRSVATLSGGERARVALARALATQAPLLIADEPTASLDPRHQLLVMERLKQTAREGGAVLAVTHDLVLAARYADRVIVMREGRIIADALPAAALAPATLADAFGVEAIMLGDGEMTFPLARRPL